MASVARGGGIGWEVFVGRGEHNGGEGRRGRSSDVFSGMMCAGAEGVRGVVYLAEHLIRTIDLCGGP